MMSLPKEEASDLTTIPSILGDQHSKAYRHCPMKQNVAGSSTLLSAGWTCISDCLLDMSRLAAGILHLDIDTLMFML